MSKNTHSTDYLENYTGYHKISYAQKKANNYKWIEDNAEYYDNFYGEQFLAQDYKNIRLNYELANGRGKEAMAEYIGENINQLKEEGIYSESHNLKHYDILRRILTRMWGEQQKRRLKAIAYDTSKYNINLRKKKRLELYQEHIKSTILDPIQQEVVQSVFQKYGINNPQSLKPEDQQQIQLEINEQMRFKTPSDIDKFMRKDFKSPSEGQLQKLTDWLIKEYDIKFIVDEAYKDLTIAGFNCVEIDIRNNRPWIKNVNPETFRYFNPNPQPFVEKGEWWISEEHVSYSNFINEYVSDEKMMKDFKEAILMGGSTDAYRRQHRGEIPHTLTTALANNAVSPIGIIDPKSGETIPHIPDVNSPGGQDFYSAVMGTLGSNRDYSYDTVRVARIVFSSLDPVMYIEREDPNNRTKYVGFWVGENYRPDPSIDKRVTKRYARAFYECKKAGYGKSIYWDKRRTPFQNRSVNDPFTVYAPFVGVEYSKMYGNTKRIAPIDLGKVYNYEYNVLKNKIEELEQTDIGTIFQFPDKAIPANWTYGKFLEMVKKTKLAPMNMDDIEFAQSAAQMFKGIDLSNNQDIAAKMQRLEYIERECQEAMSYSPAAMGQAPASTTATKNQQDIIQFSYATEDLNGIQRLFEQNLLNAFANLTRNALRENDHLRTYLLDEQGIAELEIDDKTLHLSDLGIKIINDTEEVENMRSFKGHLQPLIQNQMVTSSEALKIQFSDNPADLLNLAEEAEKKAEKREAERVRLEQENLQKDRELREKEMQRQHEYKMEEFRLKELQILVDGDKFRVQNDVNRDNQNDLLEKALMDNASKEKIAAMKIVSDEKLAGVESSNKMKELASKEKVEKLKLEQQKKKDKLMASKSANSSK